MTYATITQTTAVSSGPGGSTVVNLNRMGGKASTVGLSWNSSNVLAVSQLQYSMDDPQRVASSLMAWNSVPSTAASSTPQFYGSTTYWDTGLTVSFLSPISAVRLFSSSIDATQKVTMKVLQGE